MLISEVHLSDDPKRIGRLLNRAIQALHLSHRADPNEPHLALTLAEAHAERYRHSQQASDVLAANLLLDRLINATEFADRMAALRLSLKTKLPARQKET